MTPKQKIFNESKERVKAIKFGEQVTNICAGRNNPHRLGFFCQYDGGKSVKVTDGKGHFWETAVQVVYPGWITADKAQELYKPVWEAEYRIAEETP